MALDKDYVLGIAVQLQDESIAAFERNLQARLERAFPGLKILATMEADQVLATSGRVTESLEKSQAAAENLGKALLNVGELSEKQAVTALNALDSEQIARDRVIQKQNLQNANIERTNALLKQQSTLANEIAMFDNSSIGRTGAFGFDIPTMEQNVAALETFAKRRASAMQEVMNLGALGSGFAGNTVFQTDPKIVSDSVSSQFKDVKAQIEDARASAVMFRDEVKRLGGVSNFQNFYGSSDSEMKQAIEDAKMMNVQIKDTPGYWDKTSKAFQGHIGQWVLMSSAITAAYGALEQFQHMVKEVSEFQVQGVMFQANQRSAALQGLPSSGLSNQDLMNSSVQLATQYGEKVNDVAQDLSLWYKRTGDLNDAMFLTNQALEFQLTTGTDLEDVYKTLTGLSVQAQGQKLGGVFGDQTFDLSKTKEVLHEIYAAAVAAGGGMRQISEAENEVGGNSNAGALLLDSIDKDNAALKMFGSTMTDTIALNAALIQAFGNTGSSASEAGEKIGRIMGSLAGMSIPGALDKFKKAGMDVTEFSNALDNHKNVLFAVLDLYGKMSDEYGDNATKFQAMMGHILGGSRQFEAVQAIYEAYKGNLKDIKKAMADLTQEDQTANDMHDTFRNTLDRLNAEWEAFAMVVGGPVVDSLTRLTQGAADALGGLTKLWGVVGAIADLSLGFDPVAVDRDKAIISNPFGYEQAPQIAFPRGRADKSGNFTFHGGYIDKNGVVHSGAFNSDPIMSALGQSPDEMNRIGNLTDPATQQWLRQYSGAHTQNIPAYDVSYAMAGRPIPAMDAFLHSVHGMDSLAKYNYDYTKINEMRKDALGNFSGGTSNGKGGGTTTDYAQQSTANKDIAASYADLLAIQQAAIDQDQEEVRHIQSLIETKGNSKSLTDQLVASYGKERSAVKAHYEELQKERNDYLSQATDEKSNAGRYGKNTKEYAGWMALANSDLSKAAGLTTEIQRGKNAFAELADSISKANHSLAEFNADASMTSASAAWKKAQSAFNAGDLSLQGLQSAATIHDEAMANVFRALNGKGPKAQQALGDETADDEAKRKAEDFANFINEKSSSLNDAIFGNQMEMSSSQSYQIQYWSQLRRNAEEYDKAIAEIQKRAYEDPAQADQLIGLENQWLASADAVAKYKEALAALKDDPAFNAIIAAFNSLGSSFTSAFDNSLNAAGNSRIQGLQGKISQIDFENSMLSQGPFAKYNTFQEYMNKRDAENLQKRIDDMKNSMEHPNAFKKMFEAAEKSLADTFVKKVEDSFKNSITQSLMKAMFPDAAKTAADQQFTATTDLNTSTTTLNQTLTQTNNLLATGSGSFASGSGGGPTSIGQLIAGAGIASSVSSPSGGASGFSFASSLGTSAILGAGAIGAAGRAFSGGYVPSSGPSFGGADPGLVAAYMDKGMSQSDAIAMASSVSPSSGGGKSRGATMTAGDIGAVMGILGASQGYSQGGFMGSAMAGLSASSAVSGIATSGIFTGGAVAGISSVAPYVGAALFLASLFHPHYNPSTNPDMYADDGYAQGVADAQGSAYTQANGWVQEDSGLKQQLGGMSQLQYLTSWYNKYPGGTGLNSSAKELWNQIGTLTGNGKGLEVRGLHQGNVYVSLPGQDAQVGMSGNWQDVLQTIDSDTQALYTLLSSDQSMNTPMISVNAYGGGGSSVGFSPWYTPGLTSSEIDAITNAPYSPGSVSSTAYGSPSSGAGGGGYGGAGGGGGYGGGGTNVINTNLYLDGSVVAQSVNSYRYQGEAAGFAPNTY